MKKGETKSIKNTFRDCKKKEQHKAKPTTSSKTQLAISSNIKSLLSGSFLTNRSFLMQAPFFFFVLFIAFVYIAINFYADKTLLKTEKIKEQSKELRFEYISITSELIQYTQASNVVKIMQGSGLKRSKTPPQKIIINTKKQ